MLYILSHELQHVHSCSSFCGDRPSLHTGLSVAPRQSTLARPGEEGDRLVGIPRSRKASASDLERRHPHAICFSQWCGLHCLSPSISHTLSLLVYGCLVRVSVCRSVCLSVSLSVCRCAVHGLTFLEYELTTATASLSASLQGGGICLCTTATPPAAPAARSLRRCARALCQVSGAELLLSGYLFAGMRS